MSPPRQGEVWWAEAENARRPVMVVTRTEAVPVLSAVIAAPLTRTIRGIPTEIRLGPEQGVPHDSVASFDNLQLVRRSFLTDRLAPADPGCRSAICAALAALADC